MLKVWRALAAVLRAWPTVFRVGLRFSRAFADGAADFADGAADFADGAADFADGAADFADGAADFADGAADFADGAPASLTVLRLRCGGPGFAVGGRARSPPVAARFRLRAAGRPARAATW